MDTCSMSLPFRTLLKTLQDYELPDMEVADTEARALLEYQMWLRPEAYDLNPEPLQVQTETEPVPEQDAVPNTEPVAAPEASLGSALEAPPSDEEEQSDLEVLRLQLSPNWQRVPVGSPEMRIQDYPWGQVRVRPSQTQAWRRKRKRAPAVPECPESQGPVPKRPKEDSGAVYRPSVSVEPAPARESVGPAPGSRRPTAAPGSTRPTAAPGSTRPTAAPRSSCPTAAPGSRRPTAAPGSTHPTAVPRSSCPTAAPGSRRLTAAPGSTRPTAAPGSTRPTAAPGSTRPTAAPGSTRPTAAPGSTHPTARPRSTHPTAAPRSSCPAAAPGSTRPILLSEAFPGFSLYKHQQWEPVKNELHTRNTMVLNAVLQKRWERLPEDIKLSYTAKAEELKRDFIQMKSL